MIPQGAWSADEQSKASSLGSDEGIARSISRKLWRTASSANRAAASQKAQGPSAGSPPLDMPSIEELLPKSLSMPMLPAWTAERATSPLPMPLPGDRLSSAHGKPKKSAIKPSGKQPMPSKEREQMFRSFVANMAPQASESVLSTPPPGVEGRPHTAAGLYATTSLGTHTAANHQGVRAMGVRGPPNSSLSLYGGSSGGSSRLRVTLQGQPSMAKRSPVAPAHLSSTWSPKLMETWEKQTEGADLPGGSAPVEAAGGKEVRPSPAPFVDALTPAATRHDALALKAWLLASLTDLGVAVQDGSCGGTSPAGGPWSSRPNSRTGMDKGSDRPASPALRGEASCQDWRDGLAGDANSNAIHPFQPGTSAFDDGGMDEEDVDLLTQAYVTLNVAETEMERQVATHSEERRQVMHHAWASCWLIFHCLSCDKRFLDALLKQKEEEYATAKSKILHDVLSEEEVMLTAIHKETETYMQKNQEYRSEADRLKLRMKQARELMVMKRELMELDSHLQDDLQGVTLDLNTTEKELDNDRRRVKEASADINEQVAQYMELLSELDRTKAEHKRLTDERDLLRARLRKEGVSLAVPTLALETTMGRLGHVALKAAATAASQIKARAGKGRLSGSGDLWDERVRRLSQQEEEDDPMVTIELVAGPKSMRLSEVPMTPRPVFTTKLEARSTVAKVRELQRKVIDARMTYRHLQDKAVQMEKSRKRRAEEQQIRQWQSTLEREAPQIADEASGQAKRFTPLGCDEEIPNFLRSSDPVKNRAYHVDEVEEMVVEIWLEKLDHDKKTGSRTSLFRATDHYLRRKLHIQCNIVEAGYSLVAGMLLYQECHDADLFYHTMIGVVDECAFLDLHRVTDRFRDLVIAMDRDNNFGEGTGMVLSEEVQAVLVQNVPYLDEARVRRLLDVLEPVTNEEGWINYAEVFNAHLQKSSFSNTLRKELLADRYRFLGTLKAHLQSKAAAGYLSSLAIHEALLLTDPNLPPALVKDYMVKGFGSAESMHKANNKIELSRFMVALTSGTVGYYCPLLHSTPSNKETAKDHGHG